MIRFLIPLILFASAAHSADGPVASAIGAVISAMQPTSTSPDNYSSNDGDDDD
jgi:hypothetical protein